MNNKTAGLPVNEDKVIDTVIDVYLWVSIDLNSAEIERLGHHLMALANRKASDVEMAYANAREGMTQELEEELHDSPVRVLSEHNYGADDIMEQNYSEPDEQDIPDVPGSYEENDNLPY